MNSTITKNVTSGPGNPRNSEGSFIRLNDGRIMFIYTRYNGTSWHDHESADLAALYSDDDGRNWSDQPEILFRNPGRGNLMSVSLLRLHDGRIALVYLHKRFIEERYCDCRPVIRFSTDEGASWSEPVYCIDSPGYYVLNNDRMVQLKSGRLILPTGYHRWKNTDINGRAIACIFYSDDGGASWEEAPGWILPQQESNSGLQEPGVIELADGRLMAWFRTDLGCQYKSFSHDGGLTWSRAVPAPEFRSPASPLCMKRNPAGTLTAIWNDQAPRWGIIPKECSWGRTPLVLAFSEDKGKNWQDHQMIENDPAHGYCYTAMYFTSDALLLAYCCGGEQTVCLQDLRIRRISF